MTPTEKSLLQENQTLRLKIARLESQLEREAREHARAVRMMVGKRDDAGVIVGVDGEIVGVTVPHGKRERES